LQHFISLLTLTVQYNEVGTALALYTFIQNIGAVLDEQTNPAPNCRTTEHMNTEYVKDPSTGDEYIARDGYKVVKTTVTNEKSPLKGAVYHFVQFESVEKAIESYGADPVLDAVNAAVAARTWLKIANKCKPESADPVAIKRHYEVLLATDPLIGTVEAAEQFKLGSREQSPAAIGREIAKTFKEIQKAASAGDLTGMSTLTATLNTLMVRMAAFQQEALKAQQLLEAAAE